MEENEKKRKALIHEVRDSREAGEGWQERGQKDSDRGEKVERK